MRIIPPVEKSLIVLSLFVILIALNGGPWSKVEGKELSERESYVHNFTNSGALGNWTFIEKPMFPVLFNDSQILVGHNWTIVCPLEENRSYHVYCYGDWINQGPEPKTDYDIYVYNCLGELEGYHTESAGLPEHLGSTVNEAFFVPRYSGNYSFVIVNDARESNGAQRATLMIIEDVECNVWHERYVEGKDNSTMPTLNTAWSYEFRTESQVVEVYLKVPVTLDMYEARLYLMSGSLVENRTILNNVPLAWEPGLYGNRSEDKNGNNVLGGYNLESEGYRGVAFASCEFPGQDMFMIYTSPTPGKNLYHLVLIGESGTGIARFLVKTEFGNAYLIPSATPDRVNPENDATIAYTSSSADLWNATLEYSVDYWSTLNVTRMEISDNRTCKGLVPRQAAGTTVHYSVKAYDALENVLTANGSYSVKYPSAINFSSPQANGQPNQNMTIKGYLTPQVQGAAVTIHITSANDSRELVCLTQEDGTFVADFKPETAGTWIAYASFNGSASISESASYVLVIQIEEPLLARYSFYIMGGIGAGIAVGLAVFLKKSKG